MFSCVIRLSFCSFNHHNVDFCALKLQILFSWQLKAYSSFPKGEKVENAYFCFPRWKILKRLVLFKVAIQLIFFWAFQFDSVKDFACLVPLWTCWHFCYSYWWHFVLNYNAFNSSTMGVHNWLMMTTAWLALLTGPAHWLVLIVTGIAEHWWNKLPKMCLQGDVKMEHILFPRHGMTKLIYFQSSGISADTCWFSLTYLRGPFIISYSVTDSSISDEPFCSMHCMNRR